MTHTAPPPTAISDGSACMSIVVAPPLRGSMRVIVCSPEFATHTAPRPAATPVGLRPTSMRCTTVFVCTSIRDTVPSRLLATHAAPPVRATPEGPLPTVMVWRTSRSSRSTRETLCPSAFVTQRLRPAVARCEGEDPTSDRGARLALAEVDRGDDVRG